MWFNYPFTIDLQLTESITLADIEGEVDVAFDRDGQDYSFGELGLYSLDSDDKSVMKAVSRYKPLDSALYKRVIDTLGKQHDAAIREVYATMLANHSLPHPAEADRVFLGEMA